MKISVVTNAFNQGQYLAAAANSVLTQDGADIEYLIVDPGSTDSTVNVLAQLERKFPGKFAVISEPDHGPSDGLNRAFERATGDWFIYLNADDVLLPGAFANAVKFMMASPLAGAVVGNGYIIGDHGEYIRQAVSTPFTARKFVNGTAFALQQSTFYRADAYRAVGGFNLKNSTSWDAELLVDLDRANFPIILAGGYWSLFRMQPNSITVSQRFAEESARTHRRYFEQEIGRSRTQFDVLLKKIRQASQRIFHPKTSAIRLKDKLFPQHRIFREALPPDWLEEP